MRLLALADEHEFAFIRAATYAQLGWVACLRGDLEGGTAQIQSAIELHAATGARLPRTFYMTFLIEAHLMSVRLAEGLEACGEALALSETQLDVFYDAEIFRLQGELLHASGDVEAAEASFRKALDVTHQQGARSFELRTATRLGRLLLDQGRAEEALPILNAACQAVQQGFETRDLKAARDLLARLSS